MARRGGGVRRPYSSLESHLSHEDAPSRGAGGTRAGREHETRAGREHKARARDVSGRDAGTIRGRDASTRRGRDASTRREHKTRAGRALQRRGRDASTRRERARREHETRAGRRRERARRRRPTGNLIRCCSHIRPAPREGVHDHEGFWYGWSVSCKSSNGEMIEPVPQGPADLMRPGRPGPGPIPAGSMFHRTGPSRFNVPLIRFRRGRCRRLRVAGAAAGADGVTATPGSRDRAGPHEAARDA